MSGALMRDAGLVAVGGALGSLGRWGVSHVLPTDALWHWPTLAVNAVGAFLLGLLLEFLTHPGEESRRAHTARLLLGTGLLGGFTTYSAFAEEMWEQVNAGASATAFGYAVVTLLLGLLAAAAGLAAGSALRRRGVAAADDAAVPDPAVPDSARQETAFREPESHDGAAHVSEQDRSGHDDAVAP